MYSEQTNEDQWGRRADVETLRNYFANSVGNYDFGIPYEEAEAWFVRHWFNAPLGTTLGKIGEIFEALNDFGAPLDTPFEEAVEILEALND